ncbi:tripartite tricarboxylate transporter TctB family protein [Pasteurellaceae bacterium LIM206]|nr:tripartite tricarboxylate transporter TctB family protein [Pasteurellaceae bacterium LIM206]
MIRLFIPFILFFFGLVISAYSYITYADFASYGAAFYPTIIGILVAVFSVIDFLMEVNMRKEYVFQSINIRRELLAVSFVFVSIVFYVLCSDILGFIITTSLILILMTIPLIKTHKFSTALFLILVSVGIYLLFAQVLQVSLPQGILLEEGVKSWIF